METPLFDVPKAFVGKAAPDFIMPSTRDMSTLEQAVRLDEYRQRWLVLVFYPLDFTFVCPTELRAFSERYDDFVAQGADVLGASVGSVFTHRAWVKAPGRWAAWGSYGSRSRATSHTRYPRTTACIFTTEGTAFAGRFSSTRRASSGRPSSTTRTWGACRRRPIDGIHHVNDDRSASTTAPLERSLPLSPRSRKPRSCDLPWP